MFRKIIFWLHLTAGVAAGMVIFIMSVTGASLAFEKNLMEFAEREMRFVVPNQSVGKLSVQEILGKVREAKPEAKIFGNLSAKRTEPAWLVALGRDGQVFVNPYIGEIAGEGAKGVRGFFRTMTDWHRWLAASGDNRPIAKTVTGVRNLAFLFLAISGVYMWFPRRLSLQHYNPVLWFR